MHSDADSGAVVGTGVASKPTTLEQCHAVIDVLAGEVAVLRGQVVLLQERLTLDSRNSSRPPSCDGPGRGNRAQRRASARKRGAQKGHPGALRACCRSARSTACKTACRRPYAPAAARCACAASPRGIRCSTSRRSSPRSSSTGRTAACAPAAAGSCPHRCLRACRAARSGRGRWPSSGGGLRPLCAGYRPPTGGDPVNTYGATA